MAEDVIDLEARRAAKATDEPGVQVAVDEATGNVALFFEDGTGRKLSPKAAIELATRLLIAAQREELDDGSEV